MFGWKNYPLSWMLYSNQICLNFLIIFHLSLSPKKKKNIACPLYEIWLLYIKKMTPHFDEVALFVFPFMQDILFSTKNNGHECMIDFKRHSLWCSCALLSLVMYIGRLDTSQHNYVPLYLLNHTTLNQRTNCTISFKTISLVLEITNGSKETIVNTIKDGNET